MQRKYIVSLSQDCIEELFFTASQWMQYLCIIKVFFYIFKIFVKNQIGKNVHLWTEVLGFGLMGIVK